MGGNKWAPLKRQTEHLLFLGTMLRRWGWRSCSEPAGRTIVKSIFSRIQVSVTGGCSYHFYQWPDPHFSVCCKSAQRSLSHTLRWAVGGGQAKPNLWPKAEFAPVIKTESNPTESSHPVSLVWLYIECSKQFVLIVNKSQEIFIWIFNFWHFLKTALRRLSNSRHIVTPWLEAAISQFSPSQPSHLGFRLTCIGPFSKVTRKFWCLRTFNFEIIIEPPIEKSTPPGCSLICGKLGLTQLSVFITSNDVLDTFAWIQQIADRGIVIQSINQVCDVFT